MKNIKVYFGLIVMMLNIFSCFSGRNKSVIILRENVEVFKSYNDKTVIGKMSFPMEIILVNDEVRDCYINVKLADGKTGWLEEKSTSFCPIQLEKVGIDKKSYFSIPNNIFFTSDEGTSKHIDKVVGYYKKKVSEDFVVNGVCDIISPSEKIAMPEDNYQKISLRGRTYYFSFGEDMDGYFGYSLSTQPNDDIAYGIGVTLIGKTSEEYHLLAKKIIFSLIVDK